MPGVPAGHPGLVLLLLVMQFHLLLVGLVAARRAPLDDLIAFVELGDLAFQFLLLPVDPFLQAQFIFIVSILGVTLVVRVVGVPACPELLAAAALVAVVAPWRAARRRGVAVVVTHL